MIVASIVPVSVNNPTGTTVSLSYIDSVMIRLDEETRFFRGIELEFTAPQGYLNHRGSLALAIYGSLRPIPSTGIMDLQANALSYEPIPYKIQTVYQIPLREGHGIRPSPYVSVPIEMLPPASFPILFRIMPIAKGLSDEIEAMRFALTIKPILSDEGAVRITPRYPENLPDRPFTLLIDDRVIENSDDSILLVEGEHHLVILSNDYRNENRRFRIERGKILDLPIALQDPTPLIVFEAPENASIFFDNRLIERVSSPMPVEPGLHEVKFQFSDYAIIKTLTVNRGKTYRIAMLMDVQISESD